MTALDTYRGWRIRHMPARQPFPWVASPPEHMETEFDDRLFAETRAELVQEIDTATAFFEGVEHVAMEIGRDA